MVNRDYPERKTSQCDVGIALRNRKAFKLRMMVLVSAVLAWPALLPAQTWEPTLGVFSHREQWIAAFDQMPQTALREFFLRCDGESRDHLLTLEDAVRCAMAWDALLKRGFANDVDALLTWWRQHKDLTTRSTPQTDAEYH